MPGQRPKLKALRPVFLALAALATACGDCPDGFELTERALVRPDQRIVLTAPDGELQVIGRERATTLELEARGCRARAGARIVQDTLDGARNVRVVAPHATVRAFVPAGSELVVHHGSGEVTVRAVGPTLLETRGGAVRVEQVIGPVGIVAGPGTLYVREIIGDVEIVDGPGALFVEGVMGSVRLRDGSGGIHAREIEGDLIVEADGSGAIDARTVAGDFVVAAKTDDHRMIRHNDVAGRVRIPEAD